MEFRMWPVLVVAVLVLLVPSCGGEVHQEHSLRDKAKVALTDIKETAVDKYNVVKRSLSAMLSRRLTPKHNMHHAAGDGSAAEELRLRTRRELHSFLDSLEPHQLMRLRRAVAVSKLHKNRNANIAGDGLVKRQNLVAPAKSI